MTRRYALYALPDAGSRLEGFGRSILGIDGAVEGMIAQPAPPADLASVTQGARVYGFHATLKPPMRLAPGASEDDFVAETARIAAAHPPVVVGEMHVTAIGPFLALVPVAPPPELGLLAAECVAALDRLRAPMSEAERARRRPERLDARGRVLLDRWGYPHVFEAFRFHMTLTDALPEASRAAWHERLSRAYAASGPEPLSIESLCILRQDGTDPFRLLARLPFGSER